MKTEQEEEAVPFSFTLKWETFLKWIVDFVSCLSLGGQFYPRIYGDEMRDGRNLGLGIRCNGAFRDQPGFKRQRPPIVTFFLGTSDHVGMGVLKV